VKLFEAVWKSLRVSESKVASVCLELQG